MSNLFDCDWVLTEVAHILEEDMTQEDKMEDAMIGAAIKGGLKGADLLDLFKWQGLFGIYNLGMKHMYEYLNGDSNETL